MKKRWIAFILAAIIIVSGCSQKDGKTESRSAEKTEPVVINFWHMDDSGVRKDTMDEIIADFNKMHEGSIKVEATGINFWDYWDKISVSMAAMEEPDIFLNDLGNVGVRAETGVLQNLSELYEAVEDNPDDIFFEAPLDMCRYDGDLFALPFESDVRLLFYNKELFSAAGYDPDEPPTSWSELMEISSKISKKFPDGSYDVMGFNVIQPQSYFLTYVWGKGTNFIDGNGDIKVDSDEIVSALDEWLDIIKICGHDKLLKFSAEFGGGAADPFIVEKLGMTIGVPDLYSQIKRYNPDLEFGYSVVPYPAGPASWSNGFSLELSSRSSHVKEAFTFARYLMSYDAQLKKALQSSALITNKNAAHAPELMEDPFWKTTVETFGFSHFRPFSIKAPMWYEHMNKAVEEAVYGRLSSRDALKHAQKMIENDVKKYEMTH